VTFSLRIHERARVYSYNNKVQESEKRQYCQVSILYREGLWLNRQCRTHDLEGISFYPCVLHGLSHMCKTQYLVSLHLISLHRPPPFTELEYRQG